MRNWHALSFAVALIGAGVLYGLAQQRAPGGVNGCIYFATPPAPTDRQGVVFTCDVNGRVNMTGLGPPPACAGVIDASVGCPIPMLGM
jgi:hypothetical protein